jgi:hypothetical protein
MKDDKVIAFIDGACRWRADSRGSLLRLVSCSADSWDNLRTLEVGPLFHFTAIQHRTGNPRNRCQARRESSTVAGAGGTWSRDRRRAEEGPRTFSVRGSDLGGDRGRRAIPFASDLRSHPQVNLGPLLRLDSRPACGDATVQPANSVSTTGLTRVSAVRSPEGPLFRAPTRTARTRNTAWRRISSGFQPRISGTGH